MTIFYLFFLQVVPLPNSPNWTSIDNDYSTGGGFWDIDTNGFIDYCTSNGNDMANDKNAVYFNNNGILERNASWRSADSGKFGHLYLGDIDNDNLMDMAVVYLGFGLNQGPVRIYRNTGAGLDRNPYWLSQDRYNSFDCAFGDVDLDGDLDLAVACGDAYTNIPSPTRIYRNNNGVFESTPFWTSYDTAPANACRFADLNNDGFLDLIVGYRRKVAVFYHRGDSLERRASSILTSGIGWVLRLAVGDYDNDGFIDLAVASNGQLGDPNSIKVFRNNNGTLEPNARFTMLRTRRYSSCVGWGDVNNDGYLDLAGGGWWEPVVVFENRNGLLDTLPTWSWSAGFNLVCETVMWADIGNDHLRVRSEQKSGDGTRKLFRLQYIPFQTFNGITINGNPVPRSDYTFEPLTGYVSFRYTPPPGTDNIVFNYTYPFAPDLGVTNWVRAAGNHLFVNTTPVGIADNQKPKTRNYLIPSIHNSEFRIWNFKDKITIYNSNGILVNDLNSNLPAGVYFLRTVTEGGVITQKVVKLR